MNQILLFSNGNIAHCDEAGNQMPDLQLNVLGLYAEFCEKKGTNLEGREIITAPNNTLVFTKIDGEWRVCPKRLYKEISKS